MKDDQNMYNNIIIYCVNLLCNNPALPTNTFKVYTGCLKDVHDCFVFCFFFFFGLKGVDPYAPGIYQEWS